MLTLLSLLLWYRYLTLTTGYFTDKLDISAIPNSESIESVASGLASAHLHYGSKTYVLNSVVSRYDRGMEDDVFFSFFFFHVWNLIISQTHITRLSFCFL